MGPQGILAAASQAAARSTWPSARARALRGRGGACWSPPTMQREIVRVRKPAPYLAHRRARCRSRTAAARCAPAGRRALRAWRRPWRNARVPAAVGLTGASCWRLSRRKRRGVSRRRWPCDRHASVWRCGAAARRPPEQSRAIAASIASSANKAVAWRRKPKIAGGASRELRAADEQWGNPQALPLQSADANSASELAVCRRVAASFRCRCRAPHNWPAAARGLAAPRRRAAKMLLHRTRGRCGRVMVYHRYCSRRARDAIATLWQGARDRFAERDIVPVAQLAAASAAATRPVVCKWSGSARRAPHWSRRSTALPGPQQREARW